MKRIKVFTPKPLVKAEPSKPKVKLSKDDPDFFRKLGSVSAEKRNLPSDTFSAMAAASHPRRRKNAQPIL
jgi:hypothetical protein